MIFPNTKVHLNGSLMSIAIYEKYGRVGLYTTDCEIKKSKAETLQTRNLSALVHNWKARCGKGIEIYFVAILTKQASRKCFSG